MKKVLRIIIVLVVVLALAALVVKRKKVAMAAKPYGMRPVAVHVADVTQESLESAHSYLGVVEAWQVARVSSRTSAKVDAVPRDEGDTVLAGELLLQLDDGDIQAQIKAAESTIQGLETNRDFWAAEDRRDSKLAEDGVISSVEAETTHNRLADATSKLEAAQSTLESLNTQRLYTRLTSPFDGLVTSRDVDPGDLASPGRALMVVEDHSALKIAFNAPQEDMDFLKVGLPVRAELGGQPVDLAITHIYPSLDRGRMVRVEVKAPGGAGFQTGAFIPLKVVWMQHENAVTVPRESLMQRAPGDWVVFTVEDDQLALRPVKKIMESEGRTEVQGLEPGEKVVTSTFLGWAGLADGLQVEVVK
ncbi:efflux RND transporter periplasmic adaptor subunit [Pontiellaceae bacterium B1224]|nr:efflux RND transporter periplasmic adaptor subunit [Pontiellaceae bacterium B1224]